MTDLSNFTCMGCGECCRQDGYVRLKESEVDTIARFLNMAVHQFIDTHTVLTRDRQSLALIDKDNGECIFLCDKGCRINPAKPGQCKNFPYLWKFKSFDAICGWAKKNRKKP